MRSEESLSDEWETPKELFDELCEKYDIHPRLDPCATSVNRKCLLYFTEKENGLTSEWEQDAWVNPPHSRSGDFVRKAYSEWLKNNINDFWETILNKDPKKLHLFIKDLVAHFNN